MLLSRTYISRPTAGFDLVALNELWIQTLELNARDGITGALVFGGDYFFQTIEGEDPVIEAAWTRILKDRRHMDIQLLLENDVASRQFRIHPMKLINLSGGGPGHRRYCHDSVADAKPAEMARLVFRLAHR